MPRVPIGEYLNTELAGTSPSKVVFTTAAAATGALVAVKLLGPGRLVPRAIQQVFRSVRPFIQFIVDKEVEKTLKDISFPEGEDITDINELPKEGLSEEKVRSLSEAFHEKLDKKIDNQYLSGVVYAGTSGNTKLVSDVIKTHLWANPLFADYFGATRKMEAQLVQFMVRIFNGSPDQGHCGCYTFGGTESILMALLAYRNKARAMGIEEPNMVVPWTVHPAFDKAAEYFDFRLIKVPVQEGSYTIDAEELEKYITSDTVMIAGSAIQYAHGCVDDIKALAKVAKKHNVGLHVDACLGGMLIQFMEKAGLKQPVIDFRIPEVTSISCDIHKWGLAPKGCSVVLYRDASLRKYQTFKISDFPGGLYVTASINGSKAGFVIAAAWATMLHCGESRYIEVCRSVCTAASAFKTAVDANPHLRVMGDPVANTVSFTSDRIDIYTLKDQLQAKGWIFQAQQFPPAIHLGVTVEHTKDGVMAQLLQDLDACVTELEKVTPVGKKMRHDAQMYGATQSVPDRSIVNDVLGAYVDKYYVATKPAAKA